MLRHDFEYRYKAFAAAVEELKLDGFLITHPANLTYLFNFRGSAGLAVFYQGEARLLVDSRYIEQASDSAANATPLLIEGSYQDALDAHLRERVAAPSRLGLESGHLSHEAALRLQRNLPSFEWVPTSSVVEKLRAIKEPSEVELMQSAFEIAGRAFRRVQEGLQPGLTELEVVGWLEHELYREGAEGVAFPTIVASGPRSSLPHASAGARLVSSREMVLIDFGIRFQNYCTDLTRMVWMPGCTPPDIYPVVREAQAAALARIRPGVSSLEVDEGARGLIRKGGFGDYFGHGTGHGLGLEVHELPSISQRNETFLQEGMVFTVEPGIYLPGVYGVRLEDVVVVTADGFRLISAAAPPI